MYALVVTNELTTMYHTLSFSPYLKFLQIGVVGVLCAYKLKYKKVHLNINIPSEPLPPPPLSRAKDSQALLGCFSTLLKRALHNELKYPFPMAVASAVSACGLFVDRFAGAKTQRTRK